MSKVTNIMLVGVGGQGTILVSTLLAKGLIEAGYDVKMSEIHGMAQRGGSVSTQVRFGKKVYSPLIGAGEADYLVSFEKMEALRWLEQVKPDGQVVVNDYQIDSSPILAGKAEYPDNALELLQNKVSTNVVDAASIAAELGNLRVMNVVLFGALVAKLGLKDIDWESVVTTTVKKAFVDINLKAFKAGMASAQA
ncbi:indolepyruvate oxidoreductase subunit beta [Vibrio sp. HA2012]|uniref:indolepyruvate oxidoreductase subunit beta n=1 Tax=Vibrio sp. HA2012 TaxID=1971595 RepID=UPI000C2C9E89|nr:indolepyruvate oxidoreductase subunit beta [Vibrio sp. HA2012]PJC86819.1 indolepyruvate oxidoreductase subunit beta [Vibrio sp. HA2012]